MEPPLLFTKLFVPIPQADLVPRTRLTEYLLRGASKKLTLVCAPAGYGKTTLLSSWAGRSDMPVAWLSLDADDNDPAQFLTYVVAALQTLSPAVGQTSLALLRSAAPSTVHMALIALVNELARMPDSVLLFLDDYHVVETPAAHDILTFLVENSPPQLHIGLASRSDPPLPLSRWRARGYLVEIRQQDLRFSKEETVALLNHQLNLQLSNDLITALQTRTEGWIAGLRLAALSLRRRDDVATFIQNFGGSHRFVIDYLADEVLSQQSDEVRQFLYQTSVLHRFSASLCNAVTERSDAASFLHALEEANLFLVPLDERREWYRYHQLFCDYLRSKLDDETAGALCGRAADWFVSNALYVEGVQYALAARNMELAADVIALAAPRMFEQSLPGLLGWLNALPTKLVLARPELAVYHGFVLFLTGSPEDAVPYVKAAERSLAQSQWMDGPLMSLRAHIALCAGENEACIQYAREALKHLDRDARTFRNLTYNVLGQALEQKGDVESAVEVYQQAFRSRQHASADPQGLLIVLTNLVFSLNEMGRRREALAACQAVAAPPSHAGTNLWDALNLPLSLLAYEANELDAAQQQVERALELLSAANFAEAILWGQYILARIHLANSDFDGLLRITVEARRLATGIGREHLHGQWFAALEAEAMLRQEDLVGAARWAETVAFSPQDTPHYWFEYPAFSYVRWLLGTARLQEAETLLHNIEMSVERGRRARKLISVYLLQAALLSLRGERSAAGERVKLSLRLAAAENYRRAFLDEGHAIAQLLPAARKAAPAFVDQLLADFDSKDTPVAVTSPLIQPLTDREVEVLQLVDAGYSNREIAEALYVTVGTVKKHLNNIFSKLDVKSRTQAVAASRELRLLK